MCWPASRSLSNLCRTHRNSGTSRISPGTRVSVRPQLAINEMMNEQPGTDVGASLCAAISVLKDREPGCFIVRDSHSFRGAYGLAMKVATPPRSVLQQSKKGTAALMILVAPHFESWMYYNSHHSITFLLYIKLYLASCVRDLIEMIGPPCWPLGVWFECSEKIVSNVLLKHITTCQSHR